jgi:ABC-type sugar transport system ATPase subunit
VTDDQFADRKQALTDAPLIQISNLSKAYGGVHALAGVTMGIGRAEVHALCGENGAGKSTLIKALSGVVRPDEGRIVVDGEPLPLGNVQSSEAAGIAVMHQESTAFPALNAVDNIFVGRELCRAGGLLLDRREMKRQTLALLDRLGEQIDCGVPVEELSIAQRQMVAMARALSQRCKLLIMDEPTASLSSRETQVLLDLVRQMRREGVSVLYVSHRLEEVFAVADRVTVLRDGQLVDTRRVCDIDTDGLIKLMVGRELAELVGRHGHSPGAGEAGLRVSGLRRAGVFDDISFSVRAGEIVGLAGLVGAGRSEVARAIFGIDPYDEGTVRIGGRPLPRGSVRAAMAQGLALVPEDRQHEGLILPMSVGANLSLAVLRTLKRGGLISSQHELALVRKQMEDLFIKAAGPDVPAETLSGGNQQKLVIGKWLASQPRVLILDEPTRGVDVGAKAQVHRLIRELAAKGLATLMISSELPEILSISDRILVMREGRIAGELDGAGATQEQVLALALPDARKAAVAS